MARGASVVLELGRARDRRRRLGVSRGGLVRSRPSAATVDVIVRTMSLIADAGASAHPDVELVTVLRSVTANQTCARGRVLAGGGRARSSPTSCPRHRSTLAANSARASPPTAGDTLCAAAAPRRSCRSLARPAVVGQLSRSVYRFLSSSVRSCGPVRRVTSGHPLRGRSCPRPTAWWALRWQCISWIL